jgi:hypothetical protein
MVERGEAMAALLKLFWCVELLAGNRILVNELN